MTIPVRVRPPFWLSLPFWLLVFTTLGALGYTAHRARIAQLRRLEATRRRIADDLHDGIGSKISSVALRLDMLGQGSDVPTPARRTLMGVANTARGVVDDLRDTVWLIDSEHDDLAAVVSRMEQFAITTLGERGKVQGPTTVPTRPLAMLDRRDVYLLFTEAVHNAVRHSGASHVAVRITTSSAHVGFVVEDDGVGFDPEAVRRGRGLGTMRRRAEALDGVVSWTPRLEGGTVVRFHADLG